MRLATNAAAVGCEFRGLGNGRDALPAEGWLVSGAFGGEHCCVGGAEQVLGVVGVGWEGGPAETGVHLQLGGGDGERFGEGLCDPVCDGGGVLRVLPAAMRIANSSPPSRATVSFGRVQLVRRWAMATRSSSPASWPS
jgi:hypothetical protein